MHCTGHTSTHARSFTSMHASVMIAMPLMRARAYPGRAPRNQRVGPTISSMTPNSSAVAESSDAPWSSSWSMRVGRKTRPLPEDAPDAVPHRALVLGPLLGVPRRADGGRGGRAAQRDRRVRRRPPRAGAAGEQHGRGTEGPAEAGHRHGRPEQGDDVEDREHVVDRTARTVDQQLDRLAGPPVETHQLGGGVGRRGGVEPAPQQHGPTFVQPPHRVTASGFVDDRHQQRLLAFRGLPVRRERVRDVRTVRRNRHESGPPSVPLRPNPTRRSSAAA